MAQTILDGLGVLRMLAFISAALAIRTKLVTQHEELLRMAEREHESPSSLMNRLAWDTLRMKGRNDSRISAQRSLPV